MRRRASILLAIVALAAALAAAVVVLWPRPEAEPEGLPVVVFSGPTMGTRYEVTLVRSGESINREAVAGDIETILARVDALMSTYRDDSELSELNAAQTTDWQSVSPETARVLHAALDVGRRSGGAYDVTIKPLVELWSFGAKGASPRVPGEAEIAEARQHVGAAQVEVRLDPPAVRKRDPALTIDLSSIVPGYTSDLIAEALDRRGVSRYLVDVGGELKARGRNPFGQPWQVGIDRPQSGPRETLAVVGLSDGALATSGDYRAFFERDGVRYSHILDPRRGRPIEHGLTSVTVLHPSCLYADAWATALLVLGPDEGYEVAVREGLAALLVVRRGDRIEERRTPAFAAE